MKQKQAPYRVQKTKEFDEQVEALTGLYPRIEEVIKGIVWALEKDPRRYVKLPGDYYQYNYKSISQDHFPDVAVLYRVLADDAKVILMAIE